MAMGEGRTAAPSVPKIALAVVLFVWANQKVLCQTPTGCMGMAAKLSSCVSFLQGASNGSQNTPPESCCSAVAQAAGTTGGCLCQLLGTNSPLGFPINQTQLLIIPGACNVNVPPVDRCTNAGTPFTSSLDSPPPGSYPPSVAPTGSVSGGPTDNSSRMKGSGGVLLSRVSWMGVVAPPFLLLVIASI
ncbi:hypothetical protein SUGI_0235260 [Cryptomeria japonica]|nr:hypothetical protein SUGI_0235260 [Cryptomeria japonica]